MFMNLQYDEHYRSLPVQTRLIASFLLQKTTSSPCEACLTVQCPGPSDGLLVNRSLRLVCAVHVSHHDCFGDRRCIWVSGPVHRGCYCCCRRPGKCSAAQGLCQVCVKLVSSHTGQHWGQQPEKCVNIDTGCGNMEGFKPRHTCECKHQVHAM